MHPRKTIWYLTFVLDDGFTYIRKDVGYESNIKSTIADAYQNGVSGLRSDRNGSYTVYPPHRIKRIDVACREEALEFTVYAHAQLTV